VVPATGATASARPAVHTTASSSPATAVKCAAVLFVGARGTGEAGPGSPTWVPTPSDPYGLGAPVEALRKALLTDIAGRRTVQTVSVNYNTNDVGTLLTDPVSYFADLQSGVDWTTSYLTQWALTCPKQQIVLVGYSQGAMVMHRVMHLLGTKMMSRVTAAVLIADGDQVPGDNVTRYGSASLAAIGAGQYPLFSSISGSSPATFSTTVGSRVLSVCNAGDIVCDTNAGDLNAAGIATHLAYTWPISGAATQPLLDAAQAAFLKTVTWKMIGPSYPTYGRLQGVTCPSTSMCVAVGSYQTDNISQGLWLTGSRSNWAAAEAPLPANANAGSSYNELYGVACPSTTECIAVGRYLDSSRAVQGLIETLTGGSWQASEAPLPPTAGSMPGAELFGISCTSTSDCVAVGDVSWVDGCCNSAETGLVLTLSGGTWTAAEAPLPSDAVTTPDPTAQLRAVACPSATACTAVGLYFATSGEQGLILTDSAGTWTASEAPLPANADALPSTALFGVACRSATPCVAVGQYIDSSQNDQGLLLTGSGSTWSPTEAPVPAGATSGDLSAVTCLPKTCVAVGADDTSGLVVTRAGKSWIAAPAPTGILNGVACPATSSCTAVGYGTDANGDYPTLVSG
jgi:hypothetical protein